MVLAVWSWRNDPGSVVLAVWSWHWGWLGLKTLSTLSVTLTLGLTQQGGYLGLNMMLDEASAVTTSDQYMVTPCSGLGRDACVTWCVHGQNVTDSTHL